MSKYPPLENLNREQSDALEKGSFLIISARKEAAAMLRRAGVELPEDGFGFGSPCFAHEDGHGRCGCRDYEGDGGTCLTLVTVDPGTTPVPVRSCGHPASKHRGT